MLVSPYHSPSLATAEFLYAAMFVVPGPSTFHAAVLPSSNDPFRSRLALVVGPLGPLRSLKWMKPVGQPVPGVSFFHAKWSTLPLSVARSHAS